MTNKKLCPLRRLPSGAFDYCQKERCAWYDERAEECIILTIGQDITALISIMEDLIRAIQS